MNLLPLSLLPEYMHQCADGDAELDILYQTAILNALARL